MWIRLLAFAELAMLTAACGVSVHLTLLARAEPYFPPSVADKAMFTHAGAFFPDAFYSCMGQSEAAEAAHWPKFLKVAVDYWIEKYNGTQTARTEGFWGHLWGGGPSEDELAFAKAGEGLRAFIYGVMTHQVADVSWHSLGVREGLLKAMAQRDFDGDTGKAHQVLDTGGDMLWLNRMLLSGSDMSWLDSSWEYPRTDILNIFERAGFSVGGAQLDYCMARGRAALLAEMRIAPAAYGSYARSSPMLFENLESYYLGGMSEMTMAIRHCAKNLDEWFTHGTSDDPWSFCAVFEGMRGKRDIATACAQFHEHDHVDDLDVVHEQFAAYETTFTTTTKDSGAHATPEYIFTTGERQSQFGSSLSVGEFWRGETCIAVGAPFDGRDTDGSNPPGSAYVIPLNDIGALNLAQVDGDASSSLVVLQDAVKQRRRNGHQQAAFSSPDKHTSPVHAAKPIENYTYNLRFGASAVGLDVGGRSVLCVSRPGVSELELFDDGASALVINIDSAASFYGSPGLKLEGEHLVGGDLAGDGTTDLIVGAPYADVRLKPHQGEVRIISGEYISRALETKRGSTVTPVAEDGMKVLKSPDRRAYRLFGSRVAVAQSRTGRRYIVVGAEGANRVYGFDNQTLELAFTLQPDNNGAFGGDLLVGSNDGVLVVGSSAEDEGSCSQCGFVYVYDLPDDGEPKLRAKVASPDHVSFTKFGYAGTRHNNTVFVSSPYAHDLQGTVWSFDLADPHAVSTVVSSGPAPYSNGFGTSIAVASANGARHLYVGMPYYGGTLKNDYQGAFASYALDKHS